ncbi:Ca2+-binding RTX toxin-like protein [Rhodanobacter sp. K2T2]|uniref:calcium-binding protein n=1 Tax=Rhodanobacter sp. K2T2 TaxID=2723085 RepID=UPI0015C8EB96|nr:calcium-binding protein [Rhodanobacter sp. K2T2]NYE30611.1 Ca2+-binding RTX toxin-like protein [Rhodanobacter sp. K2T2]
MTDHLTALTGGVSLTDIVEKFLSMPGVEGTVATPYIDSKGIPTVGVGINLSNSKFSTIYLNDLGITDTTVISNLQKNVFTHTYTTLDALKTDIKKYYNGNLLQPLSDAQILSLYTDIAIGTPPVAGGDPTTYQSPDGKLSIYANFAKYIKDNHIDPAMLTSQEGVALLSLYFNAPATLGSKITADLNENAFNRVDAWYQIRYETNKGALTTSDPTDGHNGVAIRRDMESAVFGLYDPTDATNADGTPVPSMAEATSIYADFSGTLTDANGQQHSLRNWALNYEQIYSSQVGIATQRLTQSGLDGTPIQNLQVLSLENELQPAANTLNASLNDKLENPYYSNTASFDPLDIQIATLVGGSTAHNAEDLIVTSRSGYQINTGAYNPSLLIAQGGYVELDASKSNSDAALIGGTGNDTILASSGSDYIVAGKGNDSIVLQNGNDTVVLGEANNPTQAGQDTLDATNDSNDFTCYVGVGTHETIKLGSGTPLLYLISGQQGSPTALTISSEWVAPGEWFDPEADAFLVQLPDASGQVSINEATKNIEIIKGNASGSSSQAAQKFSLAQLEKIYASDVSGTGSSSLTTELTLDNFSGNDDDGIDLGAEPPAATVPGSSNITLLSYGGLSGDTTPGGDATYVYEDDVSGAPVAAIYGSNSAGNAFGNEILGDGNATYISAGNGNNRVLLGNFYSHATDPTATALSATIVGGSGNQTLIGVGNGTETITGGALGSDTTATTFIDGGGATADLVGGGQNSVIFGGTGADTLEASENDGSSGSGFHPTSILMAGLSFWGDAYSSVAGASGDEYDVGSLPEVNWSGSAANIQVDLSLFQTNDTYGTPFNLLGSSYDSGSPGSTTLPGSLLIGGTGQDVLIGNSGNDTLIGGNPTDTVSGTTDEVLIGGAGANLIYGANGSEIIYADMGPGDVAGWATLDASDSDTVYGGDGTDVIYGSGGNDYLYGGSGIDQIYIGNGATYVDAGSGTSSIYGGTGNDTIIAGGASDVVETGDGNSSVSLSAGEATITTGAGNDTIAADSGGGTALITEGTGAVTILAGVSTGSDTVQLGSGGTTVQVDSELDESTLVVRDVNGDLVLSDGGAMQLTLQSYFADGGSAALQFSDGTSWGAAQILQASMTPSSDGGNDTLVGSNGNDSITAGYGNTSIVGVSGDNTLTGGEAPDTIDGGSGADTIEGGSVTTVINGGTGTETYTYNLGDGSDTIFENIAAAGNDTISFGAGISEADLSYIYDSSTNDYQITATSTGQTITISNFVATQTSQHQIAAIDFADGTSLSQLQAIQLGVAIDGTTGNDDLTGTSSANYFDGKGGDDIEYGEGGNDTFVFNAGYGQLEINETYADGQQPILQLGAGITASALKVAPDSSGSSLVLTDGISGDQITLDNAIASSDSNGVQEVVLADGTTLTADQLVQMSQSITGTTGSDTLSGTSGADLFDGQGGGDIEIGNGGNDTFVFNAGYGDLAINEVYANGQQPILQLGAGITASALHVTTDGYDLSLTDGVAGDQITLNKMWETYANDGVAAVRLSDGSLLTRAQLTQMEIAGGTTGNDSLYGTPGADLLDGKGGGDFENGEGGNDTFVFNAGYGDLKILNSINGSDQPVLQLGSGITQANLHVIESGDDLLLTDGFTGDQIQLVEMWYENDEGVSLVRLADGTTLTRAQLMQMELTGTNGSDTIYGTSGADLLDGKGGKDFVIGNGGNDTFVYKSGYGQLEINETYASGQSPILELGAGITESMLHVTTDGGNNLYLSDGTNGDQIEVDQMWYTMSTGTGNYGVQAVQLADGTTLTLTQLTQMEVMGGTVGSDTIYGTSGADVIDGKGGNDSVKGNGGNDTFVFNAGYGKLDIANAYRSTEQPILQLGEGIELSNLMVMVEGSDLCITDGITGDQIVLEGDVAVSYENEGNGDSGPAIVTHANLQGVAELKLEDGTILTADQLAQMAGTYMYGTTGNDTLGATGSTSNGDIIDGRGGNDLEVTSGGNDTFVFNAGYGQLEIDGAGGFDWPGYVDPAPVVQLGSGITASDLKATEVDEYTMALIDGISGDKITLYDMGSQFSGVGSPIVQLADGTTMTMAQLLWAGLPQGTTGNDTLVGTWGGELIDGKGGNDSITGEGGSDTFVFDAGYGQLAINEIYSAGQQPILRFGAGITASDLRVTSDGYNLFIADGTSGDLVTLDNMLYVSNDGVAEVTLADGTTLTRNQLIQMELSSGTAGNDTLYGGGEADLIDGKGGNDSVVGNGGNDTFVFDSGYGRLEIDETYLSGQQPVLQLGVGITASTLHVTSDGVSLILTDGIGGDQIVLDNELLDFAYRYGVSALQFADGTTLTASQLIQMELTGTTGSDTLYGTSGADLLDGKGGNDSVVGNGGNDTFVFNAGYGQLAIDESYIGGQQSVLQLGGEITASALIVTSDGTSLFLTDGVSGDRITLENELENSTEGVQVVTFTDGTALTAAQLNQMEMTGTTANDTLYGTSGADVIDGKGGSDSVIGEGGSDTFVFNVGYGHLEINESYNTSEQPVLKFGAGITAASLHVNENANNLIIADETTGDQITLDKMWSTSGDGVATVQFADGTTMTAAQLIQMEMTGTTGADTITGTSSANLIDGKGGNDSVVGSGGNDTFVFNSGYGHLEINEVYKSGQVPVLQLGSGITASVLHVTKSGNNLMLTDGVSGDQITLDSMWTTATDGVASVQLSDGTTLTRAQMIALEMTGTTGADTITGTSGADVIDGKGGNDSVVGSGGNDTFVFNSGYGHLEINEVYSGSQQPVLQFGAGITASSLHVTESANNLIVTDGVAGDQITLDKMWSTSTDGVGEVTFANGTTLTRAQLIQMEMTGTTGADTITGTSGADVIDGKGGNDSVVGSGGNDTFVFNSGYGHLQINEVYTSGQTPILQLGAGITSSALKVAKSGNNLVLTDGVSGDQVTFNNMWTTATDGVAKVTLANGTSLTRSQLITMGTTPAATKPVAQSKAMSTSADPIPVNTLIHAMASYGGSDPAAITTSPTLNPATPDLLLHAAA